MHPFALERLCGRDLTVAVRRRDVLEIALVTGDGIASPSQITCGPSDTSGERCKSEGFGERSSPFQ